MNIDPLIYWATEREKIRKAKLAGAPAPWTEDPILQRYRFCNLRRRDDRVSQWLIDHVLGNRPNSRSALSAHIMFTALCRWINWPPTIKAIMDAGLYPAEILDFKAIVRVMDQLQASGAKVWTGAYMIRAKPSGRDSKAHYVVNEVIKDGLGPVTVGLAAACAGRLCEGAWEILNSRHGWGSFMAGQVVADWTYSPLLSQAQDVNIWAPKGPGSVRGFNRLMGRSLNTPIAVAEWGSQLFTWRQILLAHLGVSEYESTLTMMDVQNALCEVDKYLRVKQGEGRPRSTYTPETAY